MEILPQHRKILEIFIFLFILGFIIISWNSVSWFFNYKELGGLVSDFFNPYPDTASALITLNDDAITSRQARAALAYVNESNLLEIPNIGVSVPVIIANSTNKTLLAKDLDKGAVYYPGSVLPGQNGQMVILGHSSPPNWPRVKHDYIFSNIEKLATGDKITLTFNNRKYTYQVTGKEVIQQGQSIVPAKLSGNVLTLISCWPPGEDYQRIAVMAELVKN